MTFRNCFVCKCECQSIDCSDLIDTCSDIKSRKVNHKTFLRIDQVECVPVLWRKKWIPLFLQRNLPDSWKIQKRQLKATHHILRSHYKVNCSMIETSWAWRKSEDEWNITLNLAIYKRTQMLLYFLSIINWLPVSTLNTSHITKINKKCVLRPGLAYFRQINFLKKIKFFQSFLNFP